MKKRTAIIDIGSNSARLVIFEETSQYGFHLICEQKSKVRIGEGAYSKKGYLQPIGIRRAFFTLQSFLYTIEKYQTKIIKCVATSAIRDAPNGILFTQWIKETLSLDIKIIDGNKEAFYGALSAVNLLPIKEGITIDIGGGSSDMALIKEGKIITTYSLNLGTVRLKELFFDKYDIVIANEKAKDYILKELSQLPKTFLSSLAIGIGGTARTLSKAIMKKSDYPFDKLHAFSYLFKEKKTYLKNISFSSIEELHSFKVKKNRYDTIREGSLIFYEILNAIHAKTVITSSTGVREGVFLEDFLKEENQSFPLTINPSIISIIDRFKPIVTLEKKRKVKLQIASKLYEVFHSTIQDDKRYKKELLYALTLSNIGKTLTIYNAHYHAFYIASQELNYGFTHQEIILISVLLRMHGKELIEKKLLKKYKSLLPPKKNLLWLSFIYTLSVFLHEASNNSLINFYFKNNILYIDSDQSLYLAKEAINSLEKPIAFQIIFRDKSTLPKNKNLGI